MKESIKDRITNSLLYVKALTRSFNPHQTMGNEEPDTDEMTITFEDDFMYGCSISLTL